MSLTKFWIININGRIYVDVVDVEGDGYDVQEMHQKPNNMKLLTIGNPFKLHQLLQRLRSKY